MGPIGEYQDMRYPLTSFASILRKFDVSLVFGAFLIPKILIMNLN